MTIQTAMKALSELSEKINDYEFDPAKRTYYGIAIDTVVKGLVLCEYCVNRGTSRCPCHYSGDPHIDWEPDDNWFCADGVKEDLE